MHRTISIAVSCSTLLLLACQRNTTSTAAPSMGTDDSHWAQRFDVEKSNLGIQGTNQYFSLTPGTVNIFKKDDEVLTITVLSETRTVDEVLTRVIEEREDVGGRLKEVSRNFYAIDRTTGNVYNFGEEVDAFDVDGNVTHPGAWLSGVDGAKFGLIMLSHPKVGDRFYQEIAPGVAMDRFEVLDIHGSISTPAGNFRHCLQVRETTALEYDVCYKAFAPNIGMIKDGGAEIVSHVESR